MPSTIIEVNGSLGPQQFDITLDGVDLLLEFFYLERTSSWYVNIRNPDDNALIRGNLRLSTNYPLYFDFDDRLPAGQLLVVTGNTPPNVCRLRDLGDGVFIGYVSPDDYVPPTEPDPFLLGATKVSP